MRFAHTQMKKVPILMYHSISCNASSRFRQFTVSPALFAEQMAYLHQQAYTPITVTQYVRAQFQRETELPEHPIVLTFDDGFADFLTAALPVLTQYNFAATLYVSTAFVGGTSRWLRREEETGRLMLTWEQLAEISSCGIECGAHSHNHRQLDIISSCGIECGAHSHNHRQLDTLPNPAAWDEIMQSKKLLEDHLRQEIFSFAYPFGYQSAQARQLVREAGYTSACAVKHQMSSENDEAFSLARLMVSADTNMEEYVALLTGRSSSPATAVYKIYARARTPVWQLVRRCAASVTLYLRERRLA